MLDRIAEVEHPHIAHYLIQALEALIDVDPPGIFRLIAKAVASASRSGYATESMAVKLIVEIVERYLADHRDVFADPDRLADLMNCLDQFVSTGWEQAQSLMYRLGEVWR